MVRTISCDQQKFHKTSRNFLKKNMCLTACTPHSSKSLILPSLLFGAISQNYLMCCLPGCSPHLKLNLQCSHCTFFLSGHRLSIRLRWHKKYMVSFTSYCTVHQIPRSCSFYNPVCNLWQHLPFSLPLAPDNLSVSLSFNFKNSIDN